MGRSKKSNPVAVSTPEAATGIDDESLTPAPASWQYVGPDYHRGIQVPGHDRLLTPRTWTSVEIEANMAAIPACRAWFLPSEKL